jgi:alkylation response protein AidB-like acyl-CoA dehydrogenase
MRVELSDEQEFLREAVAGVVGREATLARVRSWTDAGDTTPADALAQRQGWTGIGLDEELGGQGGGAVELAVMAEELGRAAVPWDRLLGGCLALQLLPSCAAELASELAAVTAGGERVAVLCLDGRRPPTVWPKSALAADGLTLTAEYVPGAGAASHVIVAVQAGDGCRVLAVEADAAGVTITPAALVDRTRSLATVQLEGAASTDLGVVPTEALARAGLVAAVLVAADALGAATRMLEMTTEYIAGRRQFGVPVGSFQAVKHAAAEMLVDVEASRSAVRYASWAVAAHGDGAATWAAIAKSFAGAAASRVADKALFLHGAIGYTWEHDLQFPFKRAKSDERLFGGPEDHHDRIADYLALSARASGSRSTRHAHTTGTSPVHPEPVTSEGT